MNINRNNYEEFFLLYADHELSAEERQQVETFVGDNPDLQQELNLFVQSKLVADNNIVFENKELLIRSSQNTQSLINHSNYEEFFLLYLDNELNEEDKNAVEKFVDKYPSLWHEMMLLQKARVEPDHSIVFVGKEKLYRREKRKILLVSWQRIAVAAAILLMVGLFIFKYISTTNHSEISTNNKKQQQDTITTKKDVADVTSKIADTLNKGSGEKEKMALKNKEEKDQQTGKEKNNNPGKFIAKNKKNPAENPPQKDLTKQVDDISPVIVEGKKVAEENQIETGKIVLPSDAVATITDIKTQDPSITKETNPLIKQTGFIEQAESRDDENGFLAFSTKKSRMRGIFRKVSRVFEKTTNVEGDKSSVLIGNFQIAVK